MPKVNQDINDSPTAGEPSIGFARPVGPPVWWYSAFAVVIILFLIVISLTLIRSWLKPSISNDSAKIIPDTSRTLTNPPYTQDSFLSLPPSQNFEIIITAEGISASSTERTLNVDDLLVILNNDTISHNIVIQGNSYSVSPKEVYAYKTSNRGILKLEIFGVKGSRTSYTFSVR